MGILHHDRADLGTKFTLPEPGFTAPLDLGAGVCLSID